MLSSLTFKMRPGAGGYDALTSQPPTAFEHHILLGDRSNQSHNGSPYVCLFVCLLVCLFGGWVSNAGKRRTLLKSSLQASCKHVSYS
jgi:hypothetical protein